MPPRDSEVSKLLIAEPPLLVLPSLAVAVGLNEAIFLQQLHYWLLQSGKERDGRRWIYNTYEDWQKQLPFWSIATLRRIVNGLEQKGLVLSTDKYNQTRVDRTKWYSLDYRAIDRLSEPADEVLNLSRSTAGLSESADEVLNLSSSTAQPEQLEQVNLSSSVPETSSETIDREGSNIRRLSTVDKYDEDRLTLLPYAQDLAREMNDQAPLSSTTTRIVNIFRKSGLDLDTFIDRMMQARAVTQERTGSIRTQSEGFGPKPKMHYWFAVLEDLVG